MLKRLSALMLILVLLGCAAQAEAVVPPHYDTFWIIPDSDTRLLTEAELWQYTRETLSYIRNEILARAGYAFETPNLFNYFNAKPWYIAGGYSDDSAMGSAAWSNITTVKQVERAMKSQGTENEWGLSIWTIIDYQNSMGGYGNQLNYGNPRGVGNGQTLAESDPAQSHGYPVRTLTTPIPRGTATPYYCYTQQYIIPDSATRPLSEGELWAYTRETLRYIRNEILARHGYSFRTERFAEYFSGKSWYVSGGYNDDLLDHIEWHNIDLIKQVEKEMDAQETQNPQGLDITFIIYQQQNGLCPQ